MTAAMLAGRLAEERVVGYELITHPHTETAADEAAALGAAREEVGKTVVLTGDHGFIRVAHSRFRAPRPPQGQAAHRLRAVHAPRHGGGARDGVPDVRGRPRAAVRRPDAGRGAASTATWRAATA